MLSLINLFALLLIPIMFASTFAQHTNAAPTIEKIGPNLNHPWGMDFLDETTMLVTERSGKMFKIDLGSGQATEIQSAPEVFHVGQGGLLDVMVPDNSDGMIYYCYAGVTEDGGATTVERAILEGDKLVDHVTMFQSNSANNGGRHFGCRLEMIGPHVYATIGDRGQRFDAQDPTSHSGSVIRLNFDGSIPDDNPKIKDWQPQLYTKGQRNPQGMALNPTTGDIWLHEHGPRGGDEINIIKPGKNYGWPDVSHGEEYAGGKIGIGTSAPQFEDPVWVWVPSIAPSGMAFYDGDMFPQYRGHLLVGSLKFRSLYLVELADNKPVSERVLFKNLIGRIRDVAVDKEGAIYLLNDEADGGLYRLSQ